MSSMIRVSIRAPKGKPLTPTKASRARRFPLQGKAKNVHKDLGLFPILLWHQPKKTETQDLSLGIEPGKLYSGSGVVSHQATRILAHGQLPFPSVTPKMTTRRILKRSRRGRQINPQIPFAPPCHRQKRPPNRRQSQLQPSIIAHREQK